MPAQKKSKPAAPTNSCTSALHTAPLRRSVRLLLHQNPRDPNTHNTKELTNTPTPKSHRQKPSEKPTNSSKTCALSADRSPKVPNFSNVVENFSHVRRSRRLSLLRKANKIDDLHNDNDIESEAGSVYVSTRKCKNKKGTLADEVNGDVGVERSEGVSRDGIEVVLGLSAAQRDPNNACERREGAVEVVKKRKKRQGGSKGCVQGWTKEQEMALHRAYFVSKPTPNFWKKVSKLVPGKSAQECFDKIHSDHKTPPQPMPRSRAKRINSSPIEKFSLSASKVLRPSGLSIKRFSGNKSKIHVAQKTVRELLQKHNRNDQESEADLFSILEPNLNLSTQVPELNVVLSTPKNLSEKQGFIHKCNERSSSGRKEPLSRFSGSSRMDLVSPPVLKQVKNKVLHEKYIDQLHCREAKRNAACSRARKPTPGKENRVQVNSQKIDLVRAAKHALVSDVRDAINQLKRLQANASCDANASDFDIYNVDSDDAEVDNGI